MPPPSAASRVRLRVLIVFHCVVISFPICFNVPKSVWPFPTFSNLAAFSFSSPSWPCRTARTWLASLLTSSKGSWARFATSKASRVRRSVVVIRCFSRDGIRCVYSFTGKSGIVWRRSVMRGDACWEFGEVDSGRACIRI